MQIWKTLLMIKKKWIEKKKQQKQEQTNTRFKLRSTETQPRYNGRLGERRNWDGHPSSYQRYPTGFNFG